jgi:multidrug efflux pump subunit AcrA (membrane-fusion protein)
VSPGGKAGVAAVAAAADVSPATVTMIANSRKPRRHQAKARDVYLGTSKVAPSDIDQVAIGAEAVVRILAGNQRTMPVITGRLTRVSADLTRDQQQQNPLQPPEAYYTVRIALPSAEVARLNDIRLVPGMPVEAFIQTYERTPLEYPVKPLREQIARIVSGAMTRGTVPPREV